MAACHLSSFWLFTQRVVPSGPGTHSFSFHASEHHICHWWLFLANNFTAQTLWLVGNSICCALWLPLYTVAKKCRIFSVQPKQTRPHKWNFLSSDTNLCIHLPSPSGFPSGRCSTDRNLRGPQEGSSWTGGKRESWICFFLLSNYSLITLPLPKACFVSLSEPAVQTKLQFTNQHFKVDSQQALLSPLATVERHHLACLPTYNNWSNILGKKNLKCLMQKVNNCFASYSRSTCGFISLLRTSRS